MTSTAKTNWESSIPTPYFTLPGGGTMKTTQIRIPEAVVRSLLKTQKRGFRMLDDNRAYRIIREHVKRLVDTSGSKRMIMSYVNEGDWNGERTYYRILIVYPNG